MQSGALTVSMIWVFAVAILASVLLSLGLNRTMLALGPWLGLMDQPGERRIHSKAIPRAGGIAIWLTFLAVVVTGFWTGWFEGAGQLSWEWLAAFGAGSAVLIVVGFLDDRNGLSPLVKLVAHALAPTLYFLIHPVKTGFLPQGWPMMYDYVLFVGWVVVLINAFNLIDGLDGLCGGLATVSSVALAAMALMNGRTDSALLLLVMTGALLGFLKYNAHPARIFLGDAGSMLMGFFLATAATQAVGRRAVIGSILLPIAVAGVPLLDVLLAIWRRGARRLVRQLRGEKILGGIFQADSDHLHHRLLASGGSQRKVATVLHGIAVVFALLAFLPVVFGDKVVGLSVVGFLVVAMVGVRNLARVEMEHTGDVVHMAIKLPTNRRRVAVGLFVYDLVALLAAGMLAVLLETNRMTRGPEFSQLVKFVLLFTILSSVATVVVRVHLHLWARATMRNVVSLQFWLLVAAIGTFSLFSLAYSAMEWSAMRLTVMSYLFACIGVSLPRVALDLLRDLGLEALHHRAKKHQAEGYGPVVVVGAGDLGTLLLEHLKSSPPALYPGLKVVGFLDESKALHGRQLRSFKVLGGLSVVPRLVREADLKGLILAINKPSQEFLEKLDALVAEHGLKIYRWKVGIAEELPEDRPVMPLVDEVPEPDGELGAKLEQVRVAEKDPVGREGREVVV